MTRPSLLDPKFVYRKAAETDIRKTFARIRREMAQQAKPSNVQPLRKTK